MRLFNELSRIESELIRLDMIISTLNLVGVGADQSSSKNDVNNAISFLHEELETVSKALRVYFDEAWQADIDTDKK